MNDIGLLLKAVKRGQISARVKDWKGYFVGASNESYLLFCVDVASEYAHDSWQASCAEHSFVRANPKVFKPVDRDTLQALIISVSGAIDE